MNNKKGQAFSQKTMRRLTYSAVYLAIAMVLPMLTGHVPEIGAMLCPMHIPALLCGFVCGWPWGLAAGFISPLLRSGIMYRALPRKKWCIYLSLITAMVAGRIVWGGVQFALAGLRGTKFSLSLFMAGAVTTAIPGIILQLVLIPVLVMMMEKAHLVLEDQ